MHGRAAPRTFTSFMEVLEHVLSTVSFASLSVATSSSFIVIPVLGDDMMISSGKSCPRTDVGNALLNCRSALIAPAITMKNSMMTNTTSIIGAI